MNMNTDAILALPTQDKLALLELLWEDLGRAGSTTPPAPEWAEKEALRRRDEMLANPDSGLTQEETWAKIDQRNG